MTITIDAIFDGEVLRPQEPVTLEPHQRYSIIIIGPDAAPVTEANAWDTLQSCAGTYDGPEDWSEQHDHYIYGSPRA